MSKDEIFIKIAQASPNVLAQVASVLEGKNATLADIRTITLTEAAERLGVSRPTIYRMVRDGKIQTTFLNGVDRVRVQSLIEYATQPSTRLAAIKA